MRQDSYFQLPADWEGICYLALLFPKMYHVYSADALIMTSHRHTRIIGDKTQPVGDIFGTIIPPGVAALNDEKIRKLSTVVDKFTTSTSGALLVVIQN